MNIISSFFQGISVSFQNDGYLNATEIAKSLNKQVGDYLRLERTQEYLSALVERLSETGNPISDKKQLVIVKKGGKSTLQGTWLHPKVAVDFARWLSAKFAVWCDEQIETILYGNREYSSPTTPDERAGLRAAVTMLTTKRGLLHNEAYNLVHQRFNVEHIEDIPREQLSEAVEYVHRLALEGELLPKSNSYQDEAYKDKQRIAAISLMTVGGEMHHRQKAYFRKLDELLVDAKEIIDLIQQYNGAIYDGLCEAQFKLCFSSEIMTEGRRLGRERASLR
ncbi:KilA-N domain-containing protein [Suttonella ornithocola]|uniref:KilA-N domain n=1 Tax=Suttonella ornithocola TaxID=279832 RepID=A0A380MRL4_9GAMM|nr:KilA-N domain-containing protein [Suttonella ornithocola]SUO95279.1 KilA-N domain [Suttonella ornithocola]